MTPWRSTPPTSTWWRRERRTFWRSTPALPERGFSPFPPWSSRAGSGARGPGRLRPDLLLPRRGPGPHLPHAQGAPRPGGRGGGEERPGLRPGPAFRGELRPSGPGGGGGAAPAPRAGPGLPAAALFRELPRLVPTPGSSSPSRTRKARGSTPTTSATPRRWSGSGRPSGGGGPAFGPEAPLPPRPGPGGGAPLGPALPLPGRRRLSSPPPAFLRLARVL